MGNYMDRNVSTSCKVTTGVCVSKINYNPEMQNYTYTIINLQIHEEGQNSSAASHDSTGRGITVSVFIRLNLHGKQKVPVKKLYPGPCQRLLDGGSVGRSCRWHPGSSPSPG